MELYLFIPILAVVLILFIRSFNFSQFQGIFLLGVIAAVLISYYSGFPFWLPLVYAFISEIIVNLLVGLKGSNFHPKVYNYLLTALGLFPWALNVWASVIYLFFGVLGFTIGFWGRSGAKKHVYSFDLMGILSGVSAAALFLSFL